MELILNKKKTKILLVYPNQMLQNLIPVNISLLSACLKKDGFNVEVFDTTFYKTEEESGDEVRVRNLQIRPFDLSEYGIKVKNANVFEDFRKMVHHYKPDIIGYTITDDTFPLAYKLMHSTRDYNGLTVAGGAFPTFAPEKAISYPLINAICVGEGEEALVELAQAVEDKSDYTHIKNLWVKKDGRTIKNPLRAPVNLDSLPEVDLAIWEKERFFRPMQGKVYKMAPIYTDRGCPYQCTYCCASSYSNMYSKAKLGNYCRFRSIRNAIKEIRGLIKKYSVEYIYFSAETFLLLRNDLFDELIREYKKIGLPFWFQSRPENVTHEKIKRLKAIGADRVSIGLESGNEHYRRTKLKRDFSNADAIRYFDIIAEEGLKSSVNNIIGFPDESREMIFDTINLNRQLKTDSISVFYFTPYHGTFLRDYCIQKGYLENENKPADRRKDTNLKMPQILSTELKGLMRTFPMYVRFEKELYPFIQRAEKMDKEGNEEFNRLSEIFRERFFN